MKRFAWFYLGMHVKRWFVLIFLGMFIVAIGLNEQLSLIKEQLVLLLELPNYFNLLLIIGGCLVVLLGIMRLTSSLITQVAPVVDEDLVDIIYRQRLLKRGPKVVAFGGGTGLPVVLHGIKEFTSNITAVVAVSDDGGSSGELRKRMNIPPPGDIRNCLVALADAEPLMGKLFLYRFEQKANLSSHNFGNLFIAALTAVVGDFEEAVRLSSKILSIRGRVVPVTSANIKLRAYFTDGTSAEGEARIPKVQKEIKRIELVPSDCKVNPEVLTQLAEADIIIIGPGSLYTSIIPTLLVSGVADAIRKSTAVKLYVSNVMTQPGESTDFMAHHHLQAINEHSAGPLVDYILINDAEIEEPLLEKYRQKGAIPVNFDSEKLASLGVKVIREPIISKTDFVRHDGDALASAIFDLWLKCREKEGIA